MSEAKKVYVITKGFHSDRHVIGVYSTKEKAEAFMNGCEDVGDYGCGEYTIDQIEEIEGKELVRVYSVALYFDTGEFHNRMWSYGEDPIVQESAELRTRGDRKCKIDVADIDRNGKGVLGVTVASPVSAEHAVKVAVEQRQQWLREQLAGGTPR